MLMRHLHSLSLRSMTFPSWASSHPSPTIYNPWFTPNKKYASKSTPVMKYEQAKMTSERCFIKDRHRERLHIYALPTGSRLDWDPAGPGLHFPLPAWCAVVFCCPEGRGGLLTSCSTLCFVLPEQVYWWHPDTTRGEAELKTLTVGHPSWKE